MNVERGIQALERHWQVALPRAFARLYEACAQPFLSPCEFLGLEEMLEDAERWPGMLPQFLPFGHDGDEDFYGFYVPQTLSGRDPPVLFWNHEYDHYYPIASGFSTFLPWCVVNGRYLAQDELEEGDPGREREEEERREFVRRIGLPEELATEPVPRNDRELYERLVALDCQGTHAVAQLGSVFLSRGDLERARDFFVRASEATPWFADPYYLLAESYRRQGAFPDAVVRWCRVLELPIALSTRTTLYDLGIDHPEAEVYQETVDRLEEFGDLVRGDACRVARDILRLDPFEPAERLALAERLTLDGDLAGVERELLNALTLATESADRARAYEGLIALYESTGRTREAALCRRDAAME